MMRWNTEHKDLRRYDDSRRFQRDAVDALRRLMNPPLRNTIGH
jgi:hypothetical protein